MAQRQEQRPSKAEVKEPETCQTCRFWFPEKENELVKVGICRRYPPPIHGEKLVTIPAYWCGEYKTRTA